MTCNSSMTTRRQTAAPPWALPWRTPVGWTALINWPHLPVDDIPVVLSPLAQLSLTPVDANGAPEGEILYAWGHDGHGAGARHGVLYIGEALRGRVRVAAECSWAQPDFVHGHGLAVMRTGALPAAGHVRLKGTPDPVLRRWLTDDGLTALAARTSGMPPRRFAEALALRAAVWLNAPALVNAAGADPESTGSVLDAAGWALAQAARQSGVRPVHLPLRLLTPAGMTTGIRAVGLRLRLAPLVSPAVRAASAGSRSVLVFADGTVAGRDPRRSPVIAMYATDDAVSLARHLQSSEAGIAQLLQARRAVPLVGVPRFGAAPDLPAITSLLAPARAAAASSWLRSAPDPCGSVVALGARLAVASASAAPPAVMTSAWAPSAGFRQVVDNLAWAVVEQAVRRAGQPG